MISLIDCRFSEFIPKENVCFDNQFAPWVQKRIFIKSYKMTVFIVKRKILVFRIIPQFYNLFYWQGFNFMSVSSGCCFCSYQ